MDKRMWVMSYRQGRTCIAGELTRTGYCVTDAHPLATVRGWDASERAQADRMNGTSINYFPWATVLLWYAELSEDEQRELTAAGVDLDSIDTLVDG